jgi:transcription elongation factor GreA
MAMTEEPTYITPEGLEKLKAELEHLINDRRPEIAERIKRAKAEGDISDSSGYEDAKQQQAFLEGRIMTVRNMIRNAEIIETPESTDEVSLGSRVVVQQDGGPSEEFLVVGAAEADPISGRISNESPLGSALMGHAVGEEVTVHAPNGDIQFEILEIK